MSPPRDPNLTRQHILEVSAEEMRVNGFKAASLSDIINRAGVSKGALYHHFSNKQELGYAVFEEIYIAAFLADWDLPLSQERPLKAVSDWYTQFAEQVTEAELGEGCPVCNIATEMSGVDEGFRNMTMKMFATVQKRFAASIKAAQDKGQVKPDIDPNAVASFLIAAMQGIMAQGKYARDLEEFKSTIKCMADYVRSLQLS